MAEHGGTGTSHSRTAPGTIRAISVDKAGLFSWRLRARRIAGPVTRRRGGALAHRPSGGGPGCGFASDRAIPPPSQAGSAFVLLSKTRFRSSPHKKFQGEKLLRKKRFMSRAVPPPRHTVSRGWTGSEARRRRKKSRVISVAPGTRDTRSAESARKASELPKKNARTRRETTQQILVK